MKAENAFQEARTAHLAEARSGLFAEMLARIQETDLSVPVKDGPYWYYTRTEEGRAYPIYARKLGSLAAEEEVLLDVNVLAEGHEFISLGSFVKALEPALVASSVATTVSMTFATSSSVRSGYIGRLASAA